MDAKVQAELFKKAAKAIVNNDLYLVEKGAVDLSFTKF
jgi:hypothetical protein